MIKTWLRDIFRAELKAIETDAAKICPHVTDEIAQLRQELANATINLIGLSKRLDVELRQHITTEVDRPTEALKAHITEAISKEFEKIVGATGTAAKEALADARKTLRMPCDFCALMSWKFTVKADGKILCHDCQLKGR